MILKITYQGQELSATTNAAAFGDAVTELFQNGNYFMTTNANNETVAYGIDLLKQSIIMTGMNVPSPVEENVVATPEQYDAARAAFDSSMNQVWGLFNGVHQDPRYPSYGHFDGDWEKIRDLRLVSHTTFNTISGLYHLYLNRRENTEMFLHDAQRIIVDCAAAAEDISRAIDAWLIEHASAEPEQPIQ